MLHQFPFYLALVIAIILVIMLANRLKIAYPILLVLAGLVFSTIPGIPPIKIDPELIFILFLPPLLYEAAWATSWKELWRWRRVIGSFAFIIVFLTAFTVAWISSLYIPGFTLALGFLLGGIVSPPDAVSANAILKFVKVPKRMSSLLEGESLLNDASSLLVFRFALIAVSTGQFIWSDALFSFGWMLAGGIGIGLAIAFVFYKVHRLLPTDVNMDLVFTLVAPYAMYIIAEGVHSSGVLAVVSGGLFLSQKRHLFLSSSARLRIQNVWESLVFLLNGVVFMLIGLDLPEITAGLGDTSIADAVGYGLLITAVLMAGRLISAYGAVVFTLLVRNVITVADRNPGFNGPFVLGWAGMRGVVSLAAALSIPVTLQDGTPFPQRNLILFITFVVILLTLVVQGLTLPYVIRKARLHDADHHLPEEEAYHQLFERLAEKSLAHLRIHYPDEIDRQQSLRRLVSKWEEKTREPDTAGLSEQCRYIYVTMLEQQRLWLREWNKDHGISEEVVRRHLHRLDLEEEQIHFL